MNIGLTLDQYGIHTGEQANVKYTLTRFSTGTSTSQTVTGDKKAYTYGIYFTGLVPGALYQLTAESLTNNDSVIAFKVYAPEGTTVTQ